MNEFNQNPVAAAQGIASLGRGQDSMLVHMTPGEVQSLNQLAAMKGGSLTSNPHTGLPEAGFLSDILPAAIGVGASFIPGLNAALNPLTMGILAGAGAGVASGGDFGEMAKWGLGVGGGAGLGKGISSLGMEASGNLGSTIGSNASNFGAGISEIGKSGFGGYAPAGSGIGPLGTTGGKAFAAQSAMAAAPFAVTAMQPPKMDDFAMPESSSNWKPREYAFNPGQFVAPTEEEYARGIENEFFTPDRGFTQLAAQGGIMTLGNKSGGYLDGPGDGMSDSIPGSIAGKQPARLADGEFVIPADVVSHIGNGSSKAGAKQLYGMLDRIRVARTGNPDQGKQIKASKFLPA